MISAGFGPKPSEYFGWPPTETVNSERPWKALWKAMILVLYGLWRVEA